MNSQVVTIHPALKNKADILISLWDTYLTKIHNEHPRDILYVNLDLITWDKNEFTLQDERSIAALQNIDHMNAIFSRSTNTEIDNAIHIQTSDQIDKLVDQASKFPKYVTLVLMQYTRKNGDKSRDVIVLAAFCWTENGGWLLTIE